MSIARKSDLAMPYFLSSPSLAPQKSRISKEYSASADPVISATRFKRLPYGHVPSEKTQFSSKAPAQISVLDNANVLSAAYQPTNSL
jgi:hypothetical protein